MSLNGLLQIGKSALMASQVAINTTSHNIANVNTPGYNRQEVILSVAIPSPSGNGYVGNGVTVESIKSSYDQFLQAQLVSQQQTYGRSDVLNQSMNQIQQIFNDAQGTGISSYLTDYFNAWNQVSANPEGQTERSLLLQKADSLVRAMQQAESAVSDVISNNNSSIDGTVTQINSLASNVAQLNDAIVRAEGGANSGSANDLRMQRDNVINTLANLTELSYYTNPDGSVNITVGTRNLVEGTKTNLLSSSMNNSGMRSLSLDNVDVTSLVTKGQLGGMLAANTSIQSGPLFSLRRLAAALTNEVNLQHQSGFGLDGSNGNNFFNPLQLNLTANSAGATIAGAITSPASLTLDEYTIQFDPTATNYSVLDKQTGATVATGAYSSGSPIAFNGIQVTITGAVTAKDTFTVSPLTDAVKNLSVAITSTDKIAASSTLAGIPGDNVNASAMANLVNNPLMDLGNSSLSGYYGGIVSSAGSVSAAASHTLKFDGSILDQIRNNRESVSGVSLDEEATNLIQFQRAYEAGAKIITVANELMQTLMRM
ncbi:MAG: flagellar hook-associated protein FlgK [Nitrospiraceae bacterium]|nr:flagellar hook-associated protein FlgK [Nitrospiraceae bacterium]